jgi:hypothetical protein
MCFHRVSGCLWHTHPLGKLDQLLGASRCPRLSRYARITQSKTAQSSVRPVETEHLEVIHHRRVTYATRRTAMTSVLHPAAVLLGQLHLLVVVDETVSADRLSRWAVQQPTELALIVIPKPKLCILS